LLSNNNFILNNFFFKSIFKILIYKIDFYYLKFNNKMKNKILCIGDPHFKHDNVIETDLMFKEIEKILKETIFDFVVVLGDILHKHDKIDMDPLNRAIKFLKMIRDLSKNLYIIIGNHDRCNNNDFLTDKHPFCSLKDWNDTTVVDKVVKMSINEMNFCFCPYVPVGRYYEALEDIKFSEFCCFFSHQEFMGCKINLLTKSEADEWKLEYPMNISGHIHDYEIVQQNLIYTGTPFQNNSNDSLDKSISIFEFEDSIFKSHNRVYLNIPKKIQLTLTIDEFLKYKPIDNAKIKIKLKGELTIIKRTLNLKAIKEMIKNFNIKIVILANKINSNNIEENYCNKISLQEKIFNKINNNKDLIDTYNLIFTKI
jgi:DNA repair exonuclease SbcCD nuclease subunit